MKVFGENVEKQIVQARVVHILKRSDCSLNLVNRYKENLLHVSATNNCVDIIKFILKSNDSQCLQRKNAFGWTPLMQAIRNENIKAVRYLLRNGSPVNDFSHLGLSVLSLATAIGAEMFDLVYKNCPQALESAGQDDINPLCIAAMKNDKDLFFKLVDLGLDHNKSNILTQIIMKQSSVHEISHLAKPHPISEKYWSDLSGIQDLLMRDEEEEANYIKDNIQMSIQRRESLGMEYFLPKVVIEQVACATNRRNSLKHFKSRLSLPLVHYPEDEPESLISPTLAYLKDTRMPVSPTNTCFINRDDGLSPPKKMKLNVEEDLNNNVTGLINGNNTITNADRFILFDYNVFTKSDCKSPLVLRRLQHMRPPNLNISKNSTDSDRTLSFTPQFSPMRTPSIPKDVNDDDVFDESTPTPPKYKTPPRGIFLDPNMARLVVLLSHCGLRQHIQTFIEQEVDIDLFMDLTDQDLQEIGFEKKYDRLVLLSLIKEFRDRRHMF